MQKRKDKDNLFLDKFNLLNSQEYTEDIKWSSSSSSDYDNTSCNGKLWNFDKSCNRKRKRKTKLLKNISNLDITIIDGCKDHKTHLDRQKSPILVTKCVESRDPMSPILLSSRLSPYKSSPILSAKSIHQKSPILVLKSATPKYLIKVRKKLSYNEQKCKQQNYHQSIEENLNSNDEKPDTFHNNELEENLDIKEVKSHNRNGMNILGERESLKAKLNLMEKVKKCFDIEFSSESTSLNINDTPTPEECIKPEEIDILSCRSQTIISMPHSKNTSSSNSDSSHCFVKNSKKSKYQKGSLAHRLNALLKKQTAHVSLWQHERFLAENSNFVIPKGQHAVFCITKIDVNYGCYLIDVVDVKNEKYVIFINNLYVNNNITSESVIKLYEPYTVLEDQKLIINVCKFECINLNKR